LDFLRSSLVNFVVFAMSAVDVLWYGLSQSSCALRVFLSPLRAGIVSGFLPTACAVGSALSPLPG
jgi:hypothetical protein